MDSKVAAVVRDFAALTPAQQDEFVTVINRYLRGDRRTQDSIVREAKDFGITKVDLGPTGQVCPRCGR